MKEFFKKINDCSGSISVAAFTLAVFSVLSRLLGLWRDRLLAGHFGVGDTLDIYYAAFRLPDLIYSLLIMGVLSAGFIPIFVGLRKKDGGFNDETWRFASSILNILLLGLAFLGILFFVAAPRLVPLIAPGFSDQKMAMTIAATRLMFLSPILLGVSAVFGGILQSFKRFFAFALAPVFYNLGIIAGVIFLSPRWGILGLVAGVLTGSAAHLLIQAWPLGLVGFKYRAVIDWRGEAVARLARMVVPRVLTLAITQLNFLAVTVLASGLAVGSLAVFNLAYNIWSFPLGVFAGSLAVAAFPFLAESASRHNWAAFASDFSVNFRRIVFFILPASVFFIVLAEPVVAVILGSGKFGAADRVMVARALIFLMFGLLAEALILLLVRSFFAMEEVKTPFGLGLASSAVRIGGAWYFSFQFGPAGLALGLSLGEIVHVSLLWLFLRRRVGDLRGREIFSHLFRIVVASLAAGAVVWLVWSILSASEQVLETTAILGRVLIAGLTGGAVYLGVAWIMGVPEVKNFWRGINGRIVGFWGIDKII